MSPPAEPRDKGVILPAWWREKFLSMVAHRKESLGVLGEMLSAAVGRESVWDHGAVSRFISGKVTTAPMAEAFSIVLGLPRPFYQPQTIEEAMEMDRVARRYETPSQTAEQRRRLALIDQLRDSEEEAALDQTRSVKSEDEAGAGGRRRVGRASRGRASSS